MARVIDYTKASLDVDCLLYGFNLLTGSNMKTSRTCKLPAHMTHGTYKAQPTAFAPGKQIREASSKRRERMIQRGSTIYLP